MRLRDYLDETGETYAAFARRAGVGHGTVHRIAVGDTAGRIDTLLAIVSATGGKVTLEEMLPEGKSERAAAR